MTSLWRTWFTFEEPVSQRRFVTHGVGLVLAKYAGDQALVLLAGGHPFWPWQYFAPLVAALSGTKGLFERTAPWLPAAIALWTLPFLWIGLTFCVRRALDAGRSGWLALLFFVPWLNWLLLAYLSVAPANASRRATTPLPRNAEKLPSAMLAIALGVAVGLVGVVVLVGVGGGYSAPLFLGLPVAVGAITAYSFNWRFPATARETHEIAAFTTIALGGAFIAFAIEGTVCLALALPIAIPLAWLGDLVGRRLALHAEPPMHALRALAFVPLWAVAAERPAAAPALREVLSSVEIDAPADVVWRRVIAFPPMSAPTDLAFRLGVAAPLRARIAGSGVGAIRYCEFTTGAFIEPITVWEPGMRLAFNVVAQPDALRELSPWGAIHPPHLDGWVTSERGEFRLVPLGPGRTRLEGRTWYRMSLAPEGYWAAWGDWFIHRIHVRVLTHVQRVSEADVRSGAVARD